MKLVVIENDFKLPENVERFIRNMEPDEVRVFNNFEHCDKSEFPQSITLTYFQIMPLSLLKDCVLLQKTNAHIAKKVKAL